MKKSTRVLALLLLSMMILSGCTDTVTLTTTAPKDEQGNNETAVKENDSKKDISEGSVDFQKLSKVDLEKVLGSLKKDMMEVEYKTAKQYANDELAHTDEELKTLWNDYEARLVTAFEVGTIKKAPYE
ncbi:hypothetical protein IT411_04005, partial [Candidatus Peregrinibacteria bacterium]|nr:hypothetical protein [Candidatus Peregrinibacteria bacterium]